MQKPNDSFGARCSTDSVQLLLIGTAFIGLIHKNKARTGHTERSTVCLKHPAKHHRENRQLSTLQRRVIRKTVESELQTHGAFSTVPVVSLLLCTRPAVRGLLLVIDFRAI